MRKFAVLAVLASGCAAVAQEAGDRFAHEARCPRDRVTVEGVGGGAYEARGCGRRALYVCEATTGAAQLESAAICRRETGSR